MHALTNFVQRHQAKRTFSSVTEGGWLAPEEQ